MKWICTDPDNNQYGRQLSKYIFEFKENHKIAGEVKMIIDLTTYSFSEILGVCSTYYSSMEDVFELYGEDAYWIIAECIFEQKSGLY